MKWVTMWGNAQSTVQPEPAKYAKDLTLRYPIFSPFIGNKIKITSYQISNKIITINVETYDGSNE